MAWERNIVAQLTAISEAKARGFYVEVTGVTGAGKTTWAEGAIERLRGLGQVFETNHTTRFRVAGLGRCESLAPTWQNLALEMLGLPYLLRTPSLWPLVFWCSSSILRSGRPTVGKISCLRSVLRKTGNYIRWRIKGSNVVHDEGPVHAAHNVLVSPHVLPREPNVRRFVEMVPLPDLIVYVHVAPEIVVARTLARPDPPNAIAADKFHQFVTNAYKVFEILIQHPRIAPRVIRVSNPEDSDVAIGFIARKMVRQ